MDGLNTLLLRQRRGFRAFIATLPAKAATPIRQTSQIFSRFRAISWDKNGNLRTGVRVALIHALVISILAADIIAGPDFTFELTYLIPVLLSAWFTNRNITIATALASVLAWTVADIAGGGCHSSISIYLLDLGRRLLLLVVAALLLSRLKKALQNERQSARTDVLTRAMNLRAFYEVAEQELNRSARYRHPVTVAYIDIDNFKSVNDTQGHSAGDNLLRTVSEGIQKCLRKTDTVARLGGDEFAILLPETGQDAARVTLSRIQKTLKDDVRRSRWPVTFSIGVLTCTEELPTAEKLIRDADSLMYSVKRSGKDSIRYAGEAGLGGISSYLPGRQPTRRPNHDARVRRKFTNAKRSATLPGTSFAPKTDRNNKTEGEKGFPEAGR